MSPIDNLFARYTKHTAAAEWFPTGPGRCEHCHWHIPTMGHEPDCATPQSSGEPEKPRYPWGDKWTWRDCKAWRDTQQAAANGEPPPAAARSTQSDESQAGHTNTGITTRTDDELEAWAKAGIDNEIDELEADPPGTRNDALNKRALRCFRLALLVDFEPDDVRDALVVACRVNGLIDDDGIASVRATLRSAHRKAIADGPCDGPDGNVTEVDELRTT